MVSSLYLNINISTDSLLKTIVNADFSDHSGNYY